MNAKEVELINTGILYHIYKELLDKAEKEGYDGKAMIYGSRMDIYFYKYKELLIENNRENIEISFLETINEDITEKQIRQMLNGDIFDRFLNDYTLKNI